MDKNLMNISKIESFFNSMLGKKVSNNVFFTELPPTIKLEWNSMVVVDCANAIQDMNAYGIGIVNVFLYAKPLSSGKKNVATISKMENALNDCIANSTDGVYKVRRLNTYTDYDANRKLHCNIVQIEIVIIK